jgi:hypothetical protein
MSFLWPTWAKAGGTHRSAAADNRGIVPRLGPRLLLRARPRQHLRQTFRLEATDLPCGYDHKDSHSHNIGYSPKMTDMEAAVGIA